MGCELTARAPGVVARETPAGARCGAEFEADVVRGEARLARGPADARNSPARGRAAVDSRYERRALRAHLRAAVWQLAPHAESQTAEVTQPFDMLGR